MKYSIQIVYGKEQVNKIYSDIPLEDNERENNVKTFYFPTRAEKDAFVKGVEASIGWMECHIEDLEVCAVGV